MNNPKEHLVKGGVVLLYGLVILVGLFYHEIWMDEAHHWLLARDSSSLRDLWNNSRYEGHPLLWNLILYIISQFTDSPLGMQLTHWAIAVSVTAFILWKSPFPFCWNLLLILGYFFVFEYALFSRNYALITLFFLGAVHASLKQRNITWAVCLFLLANTHLFGLIISFVITCLSILSAERKFDKKFMLSLTIILIGGILSAIQILPPSNSPFSPSISELASSTPLNRFLAIQVRAFIPIPNYFVYETWNSNLVTNNSMLLGLLMSLVIFVATCYCLIKRKYLLVAYVTIVLMTAVTTALLYPASVAQGVRHFGIVYVVFIGMLWKAYYKHPTIFNTSQRTIIIFVLLVQAIAGVSMVIEDIRKPVTEAKNVVEYLRQKGLDSRPLASYYGPIPSISAYAQKKMYVLPDGKLMSFHEWNEISADQLQRKLEKTELNAAKALANKLNEPLLLITHIRLPASEDYVLLNEFNNGLVENLYLYQVSITQK